MKKAKSDSLIGKLIRNKISRKELDEILEGMEEDEIRESFEIPLKEHFDLIMKDYKNKLDRNKNEEKQISLPKKD